MIEQIINDLISDSDGNYYHNRNEYDNGFTDGYHKALVDLMNKLGIKNEETEMIDIRYSWGDEETPVDVPEGKDAWQFMLELALKEMEIECQEHCGEGIVKIIPDKERIELHYMDGEICYYTIK